MPPELLQPVYAHEPNDKEMFVGYLSSGERVSVVGRTVITAIGSDVRRWEALQVRYRNGYYDPANYGMRKDSQAVYTLRREAPLEECMRGLQHQYASLVLLRETMSFTIQGEGVYQLSVNPPSTQQELQAA